VAGRLGQWWGRRGLGVLAVVAALLLLGGGLYFRGMLHAAFPVAPPLPAAAAVPAEPLAPRREVVDNLLHRLAEVERAELPSLDAGYRDAVASFGRGVPLTIPGVRDELRKLAVAIPLGLVPGSAAEEEHEGRHALYLPTPARLTWLTTLPRRAMFQAALAQIPLRDGEPHAWLELRVTSLATGQRLEAALPVRPAPWPRGATPPWEEVRVDLAALAGQRVRLELVSRLGEDATAVPAAGIAHLLVASPAVTGLPRADRPARPNVLWVNIDTVQAAVTGAARDGRSVTPLLDQLGRQGATFLRAYGAADWTRPSNMSFLTGLYPSETGMKVGMIPTLTEERRAYYLSDIVALPLHLSRHGYQTRAIVQNNLLEDVWGTGVDVGFGTYSYVEETFDHSSRITAAAIRFFAEHRDEAWFLYLGYNAPHWPYRPTREALAQVGFAGEPPDRWLETLYRAEVRLSDDQLGPLLLSLQNLGLERETLVVVNSDHGEQLSLAQAREIVRESMWETDLPTRVVTRPGHETLVEEVCRVPLVLSLPGRIPPGVEVPDPVAMYDLPPTILDLVGVEPLPQGRGRSLRPLLEGRSLPVVPLLLEGKSGRVVIQGDYKYLRRGPAPGEEWVRHLSGGPWRRVPEELYRLSDDPGELRDLAPQQPELVAYFREQLAALLPPQRYLYLLELRGALTEAPSDLPPRRVRVRITPAAEVGALHLLEEEPPDLLRCEPESCWALLDVPAGDFDRLALRTRTPDSQLVVVLEEEVGGETFPCNEVVRCGRWELPLEASPLLLGDRAAFSHLDSDRDPPRQQPGLYLWRLPTVDGIAGRGVELDAAVQETFRGWGYVR